MFKFLKSKISKPSIRELAEREKAEAERSLLELQTKNDNWQPFETAPDGIQLLWCNHDGINNTMVLAEKDWIDSYYSLESDFKNFIWTHLPSLPTKEKK